LHGTAHERAVRDRDARSAYITHDACAVLQDDRFLPQQIALHRPTDYETPAAYVGADDSVDLDCDVAAGDDLADDEALDLKVTVARQATAHARGSPDYRDA
jgi:hypothetical protein